MAGKEPTLTDRIRSILRDSDGPMTLTEVFDAIPGVADRDTVSALLSQRKKAGEFDLQIVDRKPAYTINPEFVVGARKPSPQESPSMPAAGAEIPGSVEPGHADASTSPDTSRSLGESKPAAGTSTRSSSASPPLPPPRVRNSAPERMRKIVDDLNKAAVQAGDHDPCVHGDPLLKPFGLIDRLEAIGDDLRDVFTDALDAGCGPKALRGLFEAFYATHTTHVSLLRSNP